MARSLRWVDGVKSYELDLTGYSSGVYTVVLSRGNAQTEEVFSVGLQMGSGPLEIGTTKNEYKPGDPILILGDSGENILVTLTLFDPDGNKIKTKQTFTNKDGKLSETSFRIPVDAESGTWKLRASSGPNLDIIEFDVSPNLEEGMVIIVGDVESIPTIGKIINIKVLGAQQNVTITITSPLGEIVGELSFVATAQGEVITPWPIPREVAPGTYTIFAEDAFNNNATATFILE